MKRDEAKKLIAEQIGVGIHTSLRKSLVSREAAIVWDAIDNLEDGEWNTVCSIVADEILNTIEKFSDMATALHAAYCNGYLQALHDYAKLKRNLG